MSRAVSGELIHKNEAEFVSALSITQKDGHGTFTRTTSRLMRRYDVVLSEKENLESTGTSKKTPKLA
jgi:DNA/RNA endonuclease YhcR with UshA esterase domain